MTPKRPSRLLEQKILAKAWYSYGVVTVEPASLRHDGFAPALTRDLLYSMRCVVAVLYWPEKDSIILNQQFRVGAFIAGDPQPHLYECCGGIIDDGETPEDALVREAREETGCTVTAWETIGTVYTCPSSSTEQATLFCARIASAEAGIFGMMEDEGEEIRTHLMPAKEVIALMDAGGITNGLSVTALQWFARHHARLREEWKG